MKPEEAIETIKIAIASQLRDAWIITVITESPFSGKIYQFGNYSDGEWWEIGSTGGYA